MQYKRILIIKPSALGDVVMAMPALASLRASFPEAHITWLVRAAFAPLFEASPKPDELILFDRKELGKWWRSPRSCRELFRFLRNLQSGRFDLVLDFQGLFRTAFFGFMTGCSRRYGLGDARECAPLFYTHRIKPVRAPMHVADYYNQIVAAAGAETICPEFHLAATDAARGEVDDILRQHHVGTDNITVLVPGAARDYKRWPVERFAQLADAISEQYGHQVLITGAASDYDLIEQLIRQMHNPAVNFAGKTSLQQLIALMEKARLVVANDTGPGHIAVATGTAAVFIFGPTNPSRVGPYAGRDCVAAVDPWTRGPEIESRHPKHSIEGVTVENVLEVVSRKMENPTTSEA